MPQPLCPQPQGPPFLFPQTWDLTSLLSQPSGSLPLPGTHPHTTSLNHGNQVTSSPTTLSLSPQCSRLEQAPGIQRGAPCRPSSPHGAGHCTPRPPTGHCRQAQPPRVSTGHWEALLGLGKYRPLKDMRPPHNSPSHLHGYPRRGPPLSPHASTPLVQRGAPSLPWPCSGPSSLISWSSHTTAQVIFQTDQKDLGSNPGSTTSLKGFGWTLGVGDGQGGLASCSSRGRKESDMTERLN